MLMNSFTIVMSLLFVAGSFTWQPSAYAGEDNIATPWQFSLESPAENWMHTDYDSTGWQEGVGGFGTRGTPNARIFTEWRTSDIWMRKSVELDSELENPALLIYHDEDAEVYINGHEVARFRGYVTNYQVVPLSADARSFLKNGKNLLAVHCHQTGGGQFIDVHVVNADSVPQLPRPPLPTIPFQSDLMTTWGEQVTADNAWREYPRPNLVRENWVNLNGYWNYQIASKDQTIDRLSAEWAGKILVPFCIESKLSGVNRLLNPNESLWYHRTFEVAAEPKGKLLLHFGAVDYQCEIWVNGEHVGGHTGGNCPFNIDVTDHVRKGPNDLIVKVIDPTAEIQLRGKQTLEPEGIWYTRVSGIWQTVWLEEVPSISLNRLKTTVSIERNELTLIPEFRGEVSTDMTLRVEVLDGGTTVASKDVPAGKCSLVIANAKHWSPAQPHLYDLNVSLLDAKQQIVDHVRSYAALREVGKAKDANGKWRFTLNGKEIFHWGPLDQAWWPDGLLTPPSDEAIQWEIEWLKAAGFNMIRKHIKIEPLRYYYHCDRLGMMVWQDQVSANKTPPWTRFRPNPRDAEWTDDEHQQYMVEFEEMIKNLEFFPSIVVWTPFNEAWGQHRTLEVGAWAIKRDPTRLINIASGGNFWPIGDIADWHEYPHPSFPFDDERFGNFIQVVGEFGGHGFPIQGHLWDASSRNWGYGDLPKTETEYRNRFVESIRKLVELKSQGIAAGVYTQTTDVENEVNGLMTYDRKVIKIPADQLKEITAPLYP